MKVVPRVGAGKKKEGIFADMVGPSKPASAWERPPVRGRTLYIKIF